MAVPSFVGTPQSAASTTSGGAGSSNSLLGDIGSLGSDLGGLFSGNGSLSSIGSDLSNILSNPTVDAGALVGAGEYEAGQAQKDTAGLTSQLTTPSKPFVQGGATQLSQTLSGLTGTGTAPPPGSSMAQQEAAAKELGDVATQYGTGQLTSAQKSQVSQYISQQQQEIRQQLANQGVTDSSVLAMYDEQIHNNAAQLTQQLTAQNLGISEQALTSVQSTYNTMLNQSISQFTAGMGPIEDAVNLTVQQNTAISGELNSLFGQIARGLSGASGGNSGSQGGGSSGGSGGSGGSTIGNVINAGKDAYNAYNSLFGGDSLSAFGSQAAADTASELGSAAAPALAADTAAALTPAVGTGATAAELGTTADALAPFATAPAAAAPAAAAPASSGVLGAGAGALGAAAIPLAFLAADAFVPSSEEFTSGDISNMENTVRGATTGPGTINPGNYQAINDLTALEYENPQEFAQSGVGTGPITQFLQSLGYDPVNWANVLDASGAGFNTGNDSGHQL